jgi:hypothetical protein
MKRQPEHPAVFVKQRVVTPPGIDADTVQTPVVGAQA